MTGERYQATIGFRVRSDYFQSLTNDTTQRRAARRDIEQENRKFNQHDFVASGECLAECEIVRSARSGTGTARTVLPALQHIDEYREDLSIDSGYERWAEHNAEIDNGEDDDGRRADEPQAAEHE